MVSGTQCGSVPCGARAVITREPAYSFVLELPNDSLHHFLELRVGAGQYLGGAGLRQVHKRSMSRKSRARPSSCRRKPLFEAIQPATGTQEGEDHVGEQYLRVSSRRLNLCGSPTSNSAWQAEPIFRLVPPRAEPLSELGQAPRLLPPRHSHPIPAPSETRTGCRSHRRSS